MRYSKLPELRQAMATFTVCFAAILPASLGAQDAFDRVQAEVASMEKLTQVMVDKIFSFSELGQQEFETSAYVTGILDENGWEVERGSAGIPTAWFARWGSGSPVISFGSDIDGIPKANQKPGVAWHDPLVPGAPGHGEGHNSGQAVNVTAALALQKVMEEEGIEGTLVLWPGVAEEQLASKAWFVRDGYFDDIDLVIFTHVGNNLGVSWGQANGTGLVSVEFSFAGEAAHSAGSPWRARSSLDAVELMNVGWNFRREHLHPNQRSHYIIPDGGDQPNVVPQTASVWYYIREMDFDDILRNYDIAKNIAEGAALMTDTEMTYRVRGAAAPRHFNKVVAESMWEHIEHVGLPEWTEDDQALARAVQAEVGNDSTPGLNSELDEIGAPPEEENDRRSGGSDDIGDIGLDGAHGHAPLPVQYPGPPGPPLVERDRDGHADRAQGGDGGRQGARADRASAVHGARSGGGGPDVLPGRAEQGPAVSAVHHGGRSSPDRPEHGHHGPVPAAAGALLLRRDEVRHVSRTAGDHLPDAPPLG